jgi:hypothetical protein
MQFNNNEFENLKKGIEKNYSVYMLSLEILNNLVLLKKKDGSDFKDLKKCFDIEGLKAHFSNKKVQWLYLNNEETYWSIHFKIDGFESSVAFDKEIREDEMTPEEKEKNADRIIRGTWRVPYMLINSADEIKAQIEKKKDLYIKYIQRERIAYSQLDDLKKITIDYINKYNETCSKTSFYYSDIQKLFTA